MRMNDRSRKGWNDRKKTIQTIQSIEEIDQIWGRFAKTGREVQQRNGRRTKKRLKVEYKMIWKRTEQQQRQNKEGERRKTQGRTTEEIERDAKGDLNHNRLLNFTRSRFTKDPRAGTTSRALPHTFNKLRELLCVLYACVCYTEGESKKTW